MTDGRIPDATWQMIDDLITTALTQGSAPTIALLDAMWENTDAGMLRAMCLALTAFEVSHCRTYANAGPGQPLDVWRQRLAEVRHPGLALPQMVLEDIRPSPNRNARRAAQRRRQGRN